MHALWKSGASDKIWIRKSHLPDPVLNRLKGISIRGGERDHTGLGIYNVNNKYYDWKFEWENCTQIHTSIVGLGESIKFILTRRVPDHEAEVVAIHPARSAEPNPPTLYLLLQKVHTDSFLVFIGKNSFAIALNH